MALIKKQKIAVFIFAALAVVFLLSPLVSAESFATWIPMNSGTTDDLNSIWGPAASNVFAVGNSGTIKRYDGSTLRSMNSGTESHLNSVWGSDGSDVFAVGGSGTILHYDGSDWNSMSSGTTVDFFGIWGTDGTDIFAVGESGTIAHYDGAAWSSMNSGTGNDLYSIWGTDNSDVLAVGESGTILHYNGSTWSSLSSITTRDLNSVWGVNDSDVFAVGSSGTIIKYDGSTWKSLKSGTVSDLNCIWGVTGSDVFAVGKSGTIAHYDGADWSSMNRNTLNELQAVWGFSSTDVFTAGWSGIILRYLPPVINSISPGQGDQGSTQNIVVTGTNLSGTSEVRFGTGIAVNSFTVLNSNQVSVNITIVAGAALGSRDVSVTTPGGSFALPESFTVITALPAITSVSPDQERQGTTQNVTITGTNLSGASEIRFGTGIAVNSFTVLSSNQMIANITIVPDAAPGARDITITAPGGSFRSPGSFTVKQAFPTIISIGPDQGNRETTLNVTMTGTNLSGASEVRFGAGIAVNSFTVLSSNQVFASITIAVGAATGARDVSVTTPGGAFTLPNGFTVKPALPVIKSVSPDYGSQGATLDVIINGLNLTGAVEMRLGTGIAVNSFKVISSDRIEAIITILAGAETGARDASITTPGGTGILPGCFMVKQGLPVIASISPDQSSQGETLTVIISGNNLDRATSVSFGTGAAVQSFNSLSPTQLRVNLVIDEEAVTGARDVSVTTPGGSSTLGNSFNIKERSTATLFIALLWVIIAAVVVLFIFILNILRKNRGAKV